MKIKRKFKLISFPTFSPPNQTPPKLNNLSWPLLWRNHCSRFLFCIYSKTIALKSNPSKSMLVQIVMILMRFQWRIFLNALHSAVKLLEASFCLRLTTFTATIDLLSSKLPLYTMLSPPCPILFAGEKLLVALLSSA